MGRDLLTIVGFLVGGAAFAVIGTVGGFYMMYGICRALSWMAGSDKYMYLMWVATPVLLVIGGGCFFGGGAFIAMLMGGGSGVALGDSDRQEPRGFEVKADDAAEWDE